MSNCLSPVTLKSGFTVPCGKCLNCLSDRRNEWSIRLAIHIMACDRMPLFLTLTYDDDHLPHYLNGSRLLWGDNAGSTVGFGTDFVDFPVTLYRPHVSAFLKEYKRKHGLDNDKFTYFGCGEYGDDDRFTGRPHYHLLFFGDDELYQLFDDDPFAATQRLQNEWKHGFVHICVAGFDGVHYVSKYVLKQDHVTVFGKSDPFTIASKGLGMNFLNTQDAARIRSKMEILTNFFTEILVNMPEYDIYNETSLQLAFNYWRKYVPDFRVVLDDGRVVFIPRAIRKKLIGSFAKPLDNPLWVYNHLRQLIDEIAYLREFGDYDATHDKTHAHQQRVDKFRRILQHLKKRKQVLKGSKL